MSRDPQDTPESKASFAIVGLALTIVGVILHFTLSALGILD